ncbi:TlpA disulfide reductase family protein [Flavivirga amylovorans]|uniref:TlpA disulfide reductase family protein n=1 Tax=Flavivirga amylovorans TaxID=870486 RepID=A0ABT8X160_9FLAO|nr:TlpA disulfide reductase family protein [Flavivirga amylovorans]MDO5987612.1 TlpA disulfide reductase family protein [Flavivirga amylovorans]
MKKLFFLTLGLVIFLGACKKKESTPLNTCQIEIHTDGNENGVLVISPYQRVQSMEEYNKLTIKDSIKGSITKIEIDTVQALRKVNLKIGVNSYSTELFTGVGKFKISIENNDLTVEGPARHNEFMAIKEELRISEIEKLRYKKERSSEEEDFITKFPSKLIEIIKKHPTNSGLAQIAYSQFWSADGSNLDEVISSFDSSFKNNYFLQPLLERQRNLHLVKIGKPAPLFTLKNPEGKNISITDFKGKYLLIDFWAYWCTPCIASFPELKEIRASYSKEKLEMISISTDKNYDKWIEAVEKHKLPWAQVIDDDSLKVDIGSKYTVVAIPHLVLISPEGKIIYKHKYEDNLTEELKKILK